ncbi:BSD domain-containing protein 1, partial [Linum perenne]
SNSLSSRRYNQFDAQVRIIQGDTNTYCDEPEDLDDFGKWKLSEFLIEDFKEEIVSLLEGSGDVDAIYRRVVPGSVDEETFWSRYYYMIYKLKQAEALRADLVKRVIFAEEEDLSWDVDDGYEEQRELKGKENESKEDNVDENLKLKSRDSMEKNPVEDNKSEKIVNAKESKKQQQYHQNLSRIQALMGMEAMGDLANMIVYSLCSVCLFQEGGGLFAFNFLLLVYCCAFDYFVKCSVFFCNLIIVIIN